MMTPKYDPKNEAISAAIFIFGSLALLLLAAVFLSSCELPTPAPPTLTPPPIDIVWQATFDDNDLSEFGTSGGFINQGTGSYNIANGVTELTIDTSQPSPTGHHAAYAFYWGEPVEGADYYSARMRIPDVVPGVWWNVYQFKSTGGGASQPMWVFDVARRDGQNYLNLIYRPNVGSMFEYFSNTTIPIPDDWFTLEVYYLRDLEDGQVIVWQDGVELFRIIGYPTVLSDMSVHWSVNSYTERGMLQPPKVTILVDDMTIAEGRLGE